MRSLTAFLLGLMLMASARAAETQQFEGVITQRTIRVDRYALSDHDFDATEALFDVPTSRILALRGNLEPDGFMSVEDATVYIKGDLIRTEMVDKDEGPMYGIMNLATGVMQLVRPGEQMYIEITSEDMARMTAMMAGMQMGRPDDMEARSAGQTRTINGMAATAFDVTTEEGITRVWASNDNPLLAAAFRAVTERIDAMSMDESPDESMAVAEYGYPVLMQRLGYDIYEIEETVSILPESVSDDLFAPPAGYRRMSMADLMQIPD